jgi:hypothetical protein
MKGREIEHHIRKQTKNMKPIDAMIFRDNYKKERKENNHQTLKTFLQKN